MSKLLTVFGATGNQGGSVIRAVLADSILSKEFSIRAITRDIAKPAAQALVTKGVNIQVADLSSKDSVAKAIEGSHTVFLVTTPDFMSGGPSQEFNHGKNVADAAEGAGIQHLIFSSLLHVTDETSGRLKHVLHFDMKANVERYIRSKNIPSTFILPGYFMTNFTALQMLKKGEDGVFSLAYPVSNRAKFPLVDISSDIGKYAVAAMRNRSEVLGKQVLAAADYYTPDQILSEFEEVTGNKTRYMQLDPETYKGFLPEAMADEMLENHLFIEDPGYYAGRSLQESLDLLSKVNLKPVSWREFLVKNAHLLN
ncbi:hypothetical protein FSARC_12782 [Fusarium sarcochroum]|uniref:NmrA-like domain-containing protein n=1 Tax=Fusarium sarcochroum TaxID=1208366 RepID=A0A8H4WW03_9HYPO|nr:hypothetical protein FSARC_12782 [Fusarium sarcochroum]